jgi:hypothetical protein
MPIRKGVLVAQRKSIRVPPTRFIDNDDVRQEVSVRVLLAIKTRRLNRSLGTASQFAHGCERRVKLEVLRTLRTTAPRSVSQTESPSMSDPFECAAFSEMCDELTFALKQLSREEQLLVRRRYWQESLPQTWSSTERSTLCRALEKLRCNLRHLLL